MIKVDCIGLRLGVSVNEERREEASSDLHMKSLRRNWRREGLGNMLGACKQLNTLGKVGSEGLLNRQ